MEDRQASMDPAQSSTVPGLVKWFHKMPLWLQKKSQRVEGSSTNLHGLGDSLQYIAFCANVPFRIHFEPNTFFSYEDVHVM